MASCLSLLVLCALATAHAHIKVFKLRASNLPDSILGTTDAYVKLFCGSTILGKTSIRNNDANPWWKEEFSYYDAKENDTLRMVVFDSDYIFDDMLGVCQRPVKMGTHEHNCYLMTGGVFHYSYTLGDDET